MNNTELKNSFENLRSKAKTNNICNVLAMISGTIFTTIGVSLITKGAMCFGENAVIGAIADAYISDMDNETKQSNAAGSTKVSIE